ncbi:uncharacterized protein LOC34618894 [Cyclospora cayetanensis]|uniref:Zinc c3hc4 type (Ring finger) domain-containing protein n=2 Tax=Cyclospora cayetanensis TaxID=88456 RepID=A0A1D3CZJ0_9EIME|nr:uncharacterized protein LOC34618894 [Cyclospora cayetanensis]OEH76626.1 zinc c3hc4 type (ring finger) domain-containing protein [Cyclospora cayetanensis]
MLERLLRFWGLPLWTVCPGAEPHLRRRYLTFSCPSPGMCWLPLPQGVLGLRLLLDALFYWKIGWIIFGLVITTAHLCVLCYSALYDELKTTRYFPLLVMMCTLGFIRLICCCIIFERIRDLRVVWWSRPVVGEVMQLLKCACWQVERMASCASSCVMFAALHVMYTEGSCTSTAPFLCRYMSVIILCFLSLLGPNVVVLLGTIAAFICVCCTTEAQLAVLFVNEPIANYSLPSRILHKLKEKTWSQLQCAYTTLSIMSAPYPGVLDSAICSICLCEYRSEDLIRILPCGHLFHSVCITRWFRSRASCPLRCHLNFCTGEIEISRRTDIEAQQEWALESSEEQERLSSSYYVPQVSEERGATTPSEEQEDQQAEGTAGHAEQEHHFSAVDSRYPV